MRQCLPRSDPVPRSGFRPFRLDRPDPDRVRSNRSCLALARALACARSRVEPVPSTEFELGLGSIRPTDRVDRARIGPTDRVRFGPTDRSVDRARVGVVRSVRSSPFELEPVLATVEATKSRFYGFVLHRRHI